MCTAVISLAMEDQVELFSGSIMLDLFILSLI
jgi:hypothetical protein